MSFDLTNLSQYIELNSKSISSKAVGNAQTAKLLLDSGNVQFTKGTAPILKLDSNTVIQDASGCAGRTPSGTTILSNAMLTTKPLKSVENICTKTLYNTYYAWALKAGQDPETEGWDAAFAQYIMDSRIQAISEANEALLWNGDTSLTGQLSFFNGILKQVTTGTYTNIDSTATSVLSQLQEANSKTPIKIRKQSDFRIFISEVLYDMYLMELANKNIFKPTDDFKLFGTTTTLVPVSGLNSSPYKIVAIRLSNLQLGMDLESDVTKSSLKYSIETEQHYADVHYSLGVSVVYPIASEVGYADLSPA